MKKILKKFKKKKGYSSLGIGNLINNEIIKNLAEKNKIKETQLLLNWSLKKNVYVIPKTNNEDHLFENIQNFGNINLSDDDILKIDNLNENFHFNWNPNIIL
jgi:diketogulonate reductase-like aldo/keto reductase